MTSNRLAVYTPTAERSEVDMREWCMERNRWCVKNKMDRWYYVAIAKDTALPRIEQKQGLVAEEVVKVTRGWYPDYSGWGEEKLKKEFGLLRYLARQGLTDEAFKDLRLATPH
jgi:hypothetical protein